MDKEQFVSYVESTQAPLRRFLVALCCGDASLADDIAQETYIKAYLSCENISDASKFKSWIFSIAYHTFVDRKRSARVHEDIDQARNLPSIDNADQPFRYQELYAALNRLSPKERTALLLFYMQGYSIKEIATLVSASEAAVKQYLSRGRTNLRGLLSNS